MNEYLILRVVVKVLIPFILLFALYVQAHGDYGPGGGFQAGVIFASAIILYGIVFGLRKAQTALPPKVVLFFVALGLLLYSSVGVITMLLGGTFLDYSYIAHDSVHGHHYGIILIELGVGITVASVMITIYQSFAGRGTKTSD